MWGSIAAAAVKTAVTGPAGAIWSLGRRFPHGGGQGREVVLTECTPRRWKSLPRGPRRSEQPSPARLGLHFDGRADPLEVSAHEGRAPHRGGLEVPGHGKRETLPSPNSLRGWFRVSQRLESGLPPLPWRTFHRSMLLPNSHRRLCGSERPESGERARVKEAGDCAPAGRRAHFMPLGLMHHTRAYPGPKSSPRSTNRERSRVRPGRRPGVASARSTHPPGTKHRPPLEPPVT